MVGEGICNSRLVGLTELLVQLRNRGLVKKIREKKQDPLKGWALGKARKGDRPLPANAIQTHLLTSRNPL